MTFTQYIALTVLQAVAEVFPIGALGHKELVQHFLDWQGAGPTLPPSVRLGMALAILAYFRRDMTDMVMGVIRAAKGKRDPGARLALQIAVATVPTVGLGFAIHSVIGPWHVANIMGWTIAGGALLLFAIDHMSMTVKRVEHASYADGILISLCQVLALIPGVGGTAAMVFMARLLGYERGAAAQFAFLLMAPVLAVVAARDALASYDADGLLPTTTDFLGVGICFVSGLVALAFLMAWLKRSTFTPFVIYRLVLGGAVLVVG
ncbi:MAG: hypothetical protein EXQ84_03605 [Rhodospirillaceae bacterium]|nr:hypothetical protein [Rhodospirillaceae bacterium]